MSNHEDNHDIGEALCPFDKKPCIEGKCMLFVSFTRVTNTPIVGFNSQEKGATCAFLVALKIAADQKPVPKAPPPLPFRAIGG